MEIIFHKLQNNVHSGIFLLFLSILYNLLFIISYFDRPVEIKRRLVAASHKLAYKKSMWQGNNNNNNTKGYVYLELMYFRW